MENVNFEWSREQRMQLIELYREQNVLWDPTCKDYKDRDLKNNAWTEISHSMNIPKAEVQAKMNVLIGQYKREIKKPKSGSGADSSTKWVGFEAMSFIKDKDVPKRKREVGLEQNKTSTAPVDEPNQGELIEEKHYEEESDLNVSTKAMSPTTTSTAAPVAPNPLYKRKKNVMAEEAYSVMKNLGKSMKEKDNCDIFGENVACQLRQITDIRSQMVAKHRINQILFEMGMAQFDNPPPQHSSSSSSTSGASFSPMVQYYDNPSYPSSNASTIHPSRPTSANSTLSVPIVESVNVLEEILLINKENENTFTSLN